MKQARITNIDTDSAGQFVVGYLHGMRMASILSRYSKQGENTWAADNEGEIRACRAASESIRILMEKDSKKSKLIR